MIGSSVLVVVLLLVAVGGMVVMNRSDASVVAENSTATAIAEAETPEVTPSPSPPPTFTATPVPFSAATITGFVPVGTDLVFAHTLAQASFDVTITTELDDADVQRLSLRGATPAPVGDADATDPPSAMNTGDRDNPQNGSNQGDPGTTPNIDSQTDNPDSDTNAQDPNNSLNEPGQPIPAVTINLVRANTPVPGSISGQSSTLRLRPADPGLQLPAAVWPPPTALTVTPTLTLTLYVDDEPTAFNIAVTLQERTVSGATPERRDAQLNDFFGELVNSKPAAYLWQTPEQENMVEKENQKAVVVNDDRVYLLAANETHYQVFVIAAADPSSQGQSGWIRREYIDGGEARMGGCGDAGMRGCEDVTQLARRLKPRASGAKPVCTGSGRPLQRPLVV